MSDDTLTIGAVMYPGFEMLDMFGPLEMFSLLPPGQVRIIMLSQDPGPVPTALGQDIASGPSVVPSASFSEAPAIDVLLVPGGFGTLPQLENAGMLSFLAKAAVNARIVCSVCTGALLLARAGVLEGRRATTNKQFFALTDMETAQVDWRENARWVVDDKYYTSSGVSAGMDMSLAIISHLFDQQTAEEVAVQAEYSWHRDADVDPFIEHLNAGAKAMGLV